METRREFKVLFDASGLKQAAFSRLIGKDVVTINRWLNDREDCLTPPWYALQFLRMYAMLPEGARKRLPAFDFGKKSAKTVN